MADSILYMPDARGGTIAMKARDNGDGTFSLNSGDLAPSATQGAATFHKLQAAGTTNLTSVKATPGKISGGYLRNRAASEKYFKLYDKASAPVLATDVPKLTIGIPAASFVYLGDLLGPYGAKFALGIAYAITGAYLDTDTTALTAADVDVNLILT